VFGSHIEGIEGSGSGFLSRVAYNVPDGTRVRVTVARSASEPAGSAPDIEVLTDGEKVVGAAAHSLEGAEALIRASSSEPEAPEQESLSSS